MKKIIFEIAENKMIAPSLYRLILKGDTSECDRPGSFVNIKVPGVYLRRPISIADRFDNYLVLIYKVVGKGTDILSKITNGTLDVITGLGNGYNLYDSGSSPLLIGGGAGIPPLFYLARKLIGEGKKVTVIMGFNNKEELFYLDEFKALGAKVIITTVDGSLGIKGFVTDAMKDLDYSFTYCCGPLPMEKAIYNASKTNGQYSLEARMGCGIGACLGCAINTKDGVKRICKDGPVFYKEEIIW